MTETKKNFPPGDYAILELFGHQTLVGRITEVERFGTKMLAIEPLFRDTLLPPALHGGAAIYRLTPCEPSVAFAQQPKKAMWLPTSIRMTVPPLLLETPPTASVVEAEVSIGADLCDEEEAPEDRFDPDVDRHGR